MNLLLWDVEREWLKEKVQMGASMSNIAFAAVWGLQLWGLYPFKLSTCLIQLGYDPFPISIGHPFFDKRLAYYFPNLFGYYSWLQILFGHTAVFTGATTWLAYNFMYYHLEKHLNKFLDKYLWPTAYDPNKDVRVWEIASFPAFLKAILRSAVETVVLISTTRPLVVVMMRQIAQLLGDEIKYTSFLQAIPLIFSEEGFSGLFRGVKEAIVCYVIYNTGWFIVIYFVSKFIVRFKLDDRFGSENMINLRSYLSAIPWYFVFQKIYPLYVVGQIKAVEGSGLRASSRPYVPDWTTSFWNPMNENEDRRLTFFIRRQFQLPGPLAFQEDGKPYLPILR